MQRRLTTSAQVRKYAAAVDRESARETLDAQAAKVAAAAPPAAPAPAGRAPAPASTRTPKPQPGAFETVLKSSVARSVVREVTRGLLGALLGKPSRRR